MAGENRMISEALNPVDHYIYENYVLINKLGIKDQAELDKVEASLSYLRLVKLHDKHPKFKFDVMYYLNLHKEIFQDIYDFAGDIRDINITKGNTPFCRADYIVTYLEYTLRDMKNRVINIKTHDDYIEFLSHYYAEINMIHPFREGNGRTLREYLREMVEFLNPYLPMEEQELDYSNITPEIRNNLINGSIDAAIKDDITLLKLFFNQVLKPVTKEKYNYNAK